MIRRMLWLSGYPAAYMRALHAALDADPSIDMRYIFFRGSGADAAQRRYEQGEISRRAVVCGPAGDRKSARLVAGYARDPEACLLFCGMYPRGLAFSFLRHSRGRCQKAFFSDMNAAAHSFDSFPKRLLYARVLSKCDILFVMGSMNAVAYRRLISPLVYARKTILHVPYPHTDARFPARPVSREGGVVRFLFLGRLEPEKNVAALIDACGLLRDAGLAYELRVAGTGSLEQALKRRCEASGLGGLIRFLGAVPSGEAPVVYSQCDVFVLPSDDEPWGVVVNEALSSGLPVIAPCWAGAAADCVLDGCNGVRLLANTPHAIAAAMRTYIENPGLARQQGALAAASVLAGGKTLATARAGIASLFASDKGEIA